MMMHFCNFTKPKMHVYTYIYIYFVRAPQIGLNWFSRTQLPLLLPLPTTPHPLHPTPPHPPPNNIARIIIFQGFSIGDVLEKSEPVGRMMMVAMSMCHKTRWRTIMCTFIYSTHTHTHAHAHIYALYALYCQVLRVRICIC